MAAPKAPVLGGAKKEVSLETDVFAADVKPHLVHETVRAELNAARAGTRGAKSRGFVAGGRSKPWRQKGTGRARAGTTRAPHWTGGGVAFPPGTRSFDVKVNRKARRAALRSALSAHAAGETIAIVDGSVFDEPSTKKAAEILSAWGKERPVVVVATEAEEALVKSFRNIERVAVTDASELDVAGVVWARSLLVSEAALPLVLAKAGSGVGSTEPHRRRLDGADEGAQAPASPAPKRGKSAGAGSARTGAGTGDA
jgi:large subunit ribosomal protein L4